MIYRNELEEPETNPIGEFGSGYGEQALFFEGQIGLASDNIHGATGYNCGTTYNYPITSYGNITNGGFLPQQGQNLSYPMPWQGSNSLGEINRMTPTSEFAGEDIVNRAHMDPAIDLAGYNYNIEPSQPIQSYSQSLLVGLLPGSSMNSINHINEFASAGTTDNITYNVPTASVAPGYPSPVSHQQSPFQVQKPKPRLKARTEKTDTKKRYRIIRGLSAGGCSTRPPKNLIESNALYLPVELLVNGASVEDICYPSWSQSEKEDHRRIIRIERVQNGHKLLANFSIVGAANENPTTLPAPPDIDVIEISCLECTMVMNDPNELEVSDDISTDFSLNTDIENKVNQYYVTSVEVIEIVELLIGTHSMDPADRRRERGRIRSNLVPFWSKKPISSRMQDSSPSRSPVNSSCSPRLTSHDYRLELAKRIMAYEIRKPRGFDKEVRILRWDKLIPALKRALQTYYTEIPGSDSGMDFS